MTSAAELFNTLKYRIVVNPATGTRRYYNHANQLHREDGPAIEYSDGTKCWYRNGKLHREDGPAVIYHNGTRKWLLNGMPHRPTACAWAGCGAVPLTREQALGIVNKKTDVMMAIRLTEAAHGIKGGQHGL